MNKEKTSINGGRFRMRKMKEKTKRMFSDEWIKKHTKEKILSDEIVTMNLDCDCCDAEFIQVEPLKQSIKRLKEEDEGLKDQLLIDFKTPLSVKSAQRFIKARFESSIRIKKNKIFGDKLI